MKGREDRRQRPETGPGSQVPESVFYPGPQLSKLAAAISSVSMALCAPVSIAQESRPVLEEIVVTASRRAQDVVDIPYNVTAVVAGQLERTRVTSIEDLAQQVPSLNLNSTSSAAIAAHRPVLRGLNASRSDRFGAIQALEEAPVAILVNNTPTGGFFPIDDVEQVEVLRGPQGTLYGSGALGGALRVITKLPNMQEFEGSVEVSGADVAHSDDFDREVYGKVSVPITDTLALRLVAKNQFTAGFVDQLGVMVREDGPTSAPILSDPEDVANSTAVFRTVEDVNEEEVDSGRLTLRWLPNDKLEVVGAYNYADYDGIYGPLAAPDYDGGINPVDGVTEFPPLGDYDVILPTRQSYETTAHMGSLDISYELGFATLSSTTSYFESEGESIADGTWGFLQFPEALTPYYTGEPLNPRFVNVSEFLSDTDAFTQEIRLVSSEDERFDYVLGAYFEDRKSKSNWFIFLPGTPEQNAATPGGLDVPVTQSLDMTNNVESESWSVYGELTWHVNEAWDVTVGARHYRQDLEREIVSELPIFGVAESADNADVSSEQVYKVNISYSFADDDLAYATFSQGFRLPGVNAFPTTGLVGENPELLTYDSDVVDNYELGVKGYLGGTRYIANVFLADWQNPQIGGTTPFLGWPAVLNGGDAESKGVELEFSGQLTNALSYSVGYAYADATFVEDFCIAASLGFGFLDPCAISGSNGDQLPASPKHSGSTTLLYERMIGNRWVTTSLNANYKGRMRTAIPSAGQPTTEETLSSYWTVNASLAVEQGSWEAFAFVQNLLDERAVLSLPARTGSPRTNGLERMETIIRPRSIGIGVRYRWGTQ